jgi:hypothetical protein
MTGVELQEFVDNGFKHGSSFEKKVAAVYKEVFNMDSPCSGGCVDKFQQMFNSIKREITRRKNLKAMGKSNQKYTWNPEKKGVTTFVKIGGNLQEVSDKTTDQDVLKVLQAKKPHLVMVDGEILEKATIAEPTTAEILKKAKDLKIVSFTKAKGYAYGEIEFGKDESEAVAFLENPENADSFSVIKESIAEAESAKK